MNTKNPRGASARASVSSAADTDSPTEKRPKLQASRAAKVALAARLFARRWGDYNGW